MAVAFLKDRLNRLREELILWAKDASDVVRGRTDPLVPRRRLLFDGPWDPELYRESLGFQDLVPAFIRGPVAS